MGLSVREELHKIIEEVDNKLLNEIHGMINHEGLEHVRYSSGDIAMLYAGLKKLNRVEAKATQLMKPLK